MGRTSVSIKLDESDRRELELIANNSLSSDLLVQRAKIILLASQGQYKGYEIANKLNVRPNTVSDVEKRYLERGINGLFDQERTGRRGKNTPSPDEAIISYYQEHQSEDLNVSSLSTQLGIPVYTVRRVLQKHQIQLQRTTSWNIRTKDTIVGRYLQLRGIYLSSDLRAVIIQALQQSSSGEGFLETRNRIQAEELNAYLEEHGAITLAKTLELAARRTSADKAKPVSFELFMKQIVEDDINGGPDIEEYHILLFRTGESRVLPSDVLRHRIVIHSTQTAEAWHNYVEKVLSVLEPIDGFTSPMKVLSALDLYLKNCPGVPFAWQLQSGRDTETPGGRESIETGDVQTAHIAEQSVEVKEGESVLFMSGVLLHRENGEVTQTAVSRSASVPGPEDFDFSSVQGYTNTVSAFDNAITRTSASLNRDIMEICLNSHNKKNGRRK